MSLTVHERSEAGVVVVAPRGRIDQTTAEAFQAALAPCLEACVEGAPPVVLDFTGVPYISSVGLRALMLASRRATAQKGRLVIAGLVPLVREVFEISRFNLVFNIFDSVDAAAAALAG